MRKLILALTILGATVGMASISMAQGRPGGPPPGGPGGPPGMGGRQRMDPAQRMAQMRKMEDGIFAQLKLSPAQMKKVNAARDHRDGQMKKLFATMRPGGPGGPGGPPPGRPGPGGPPPAGGGRPGPGGPPPGGPGGRGGGIREKMKPIRDEFAKSLTGILSKDQMAKYESLRPKRGGPGGGRGGPGGPGGGRPGGGRPGGA